MKVEKIISGGQTGADRAALDFALKNNIDCGGWCPKGRVAEDGIISDEYPLEETESEDPAERTELNVRESDGTLILCSGELKGGSRLAVEKCVEVNKTYVLVDPYNFSSDEVKMINIWLDQNKITTLNIGGQKESEKEGVYAACLTFLGNIFA